MSLSTLKTEEKSNRPTLNKKLGPLSVWALALGSIIGWGAFVMPGTTFLPQGGPLGTAIGMLIASLIIVVIASSYGYMIKTYPLAGGEYVYANRTFGKRHAFFCMWFLVLAYIAIVPLNATALGLISRKLFGGLFEFGYLYSIAGYEVYAGEIALASLVLVLFAVLSIKGVGFTGGMQTVLAICLVGAVVVLTVAAVMSPETSVSNLKPDYPSDSIPVVGVLTIIAVAPWAFIGFDSVPQAAEEMNFSARGAVTIMVVAIVFGAAVYVSMNYVTASFMPWEQMLAMGYDWPAGEAAEAILGDTGLVFLGIAVVCAVLSGINGFYMATSRLLYSVANEGGLPKWFAKVDDKSQTPKNAILFVMVVSLFAPWFGREVLGWIVDMSSLGAAIGFTYACASCFTTIKRRNEHKPFQKIFSLIGTVFGFLFIALLVVPGMPSFLSFPSWVCLIIWATLGAAFAWRMCDRLS